MVFQRSTTAVQSTSGTRRVGTVSTGGGSHLSTGDRVGRYRLLLSSPLLALVASVPSIPEAAHIFPQEIELVGYDSLLPPSPLLPLVASISEAAPICPQDIELVGNDSLLPQSVSRLQSAIGGP